jgi:predicted RNA binding protein YcfA (HicA-like mRNA interferase family)
MMERDSHKIIKLLEQNGWTFAGATGSHHHFKHEKSPARSRFLTRRRICQTAPFGQL